MSDKDKGQGGRFSYIVDPLQHLAVPIDTLHPDASNARKHNEKNMDAIKESLHRFGQRIPIVVQKSNMVVRAGNGRLAAAKALGWSHIAAVIVDDSSVDAVSFAIADNRTAELAEWDKETLASLLDTMEEEDLKVTGFSDADLKELLAELTPEIVEDEAPEAPAQPVTKMGDLWELGDHRILCGDSTKAEDVERLMNGEKTELCHADPPYGMGKEADGVANDNLYAKKLDAFQMTWWRAFRPHLLDNASAYIWGNAEDLWRLWYRGGLSESERLTMRNEIVWQKSTAQGMLSDDFRKYPNITERCLFFILGKQDFSNNTDDYWEGWEGIRSALEADCKKMGWNAKDIERICGVGMYGHWFTKSQWQFIPEGHYKKLQAAAREHDAFNREHDELKREHDAFKREYDELKREFYATRAYFDNTHDKMTDVWSFPSVRGEDRHGHATPKPVAMIARAIKSSSKDGAIIVEPFLGSGTTLIAAEQLGRKCYGMEISPQYCDVIVKRWEKATGKRAYCNGKSIDELAKERGVV